MPSISLHTRYTGIEIAMQLLYRSVGYPLHTHDTCIEIEDSRQGI